MDQMTDSDYKDEPGLLRPDDEESYFESGGYKPPKRDNRSFFKKFFSRSETPFLLIGVLLIVLILLFFNVIRKSGDDETGAKLAFLEERLALLEAQMAKVPELKDVMAKLETQVAVTGRYADRFERIEASITTMADKIARDLVELKKTPATQIKKETSQPPPVVEKKVSSRPEPESKPVYHVVSAGETLYRISRQYNLTVDALRRLNNLSENESIQTGQKLLVKAASGKKR